MASGETRGESQEAENRIQSWHLDWLWSLDHREAANLEKGDDLV